MRLSKLRLKSFVHNTDYIASKGGDRNFEKKGTR